MVADRWDHVELTAPRLRRWGVAPEVTSTLRLPQRCVVNKISVVLPVMLFPALDFDGTSATAMGRGTRSHMDNVALATTVCSKQNQCSTVSYAISSIGLLPKSRRSLR